jgi:flagellar motility protein MotE (MotC chaperone)
MSRPRFVLAVLASATALSPALAQDPPKPKPALSETDEIARYCAALGPSIVEARAAYQLRRLEELEVEAREQVEKLEAKEREAREWVTKREQMLKAATDDVVAIYAKMTPEAAAGELANMDDLIAASVLARLKPATAGAILTEMPAEKAAKLSTLIAGAQAVDKS